MSFLLAQNFNHITLFQHLFFCSLSANLLRNVSTLQIARKLSKKTRRIAIKITNIIKFTAYFSVIV